jgi:hypothetical protein
VLLQNLVPKSWGSDPGGILVLQREEAISGEILTVLSSLKDPCTLFFKERAGSVSGWTPRSPRPLRGRGYYWDLGKSRRLQQWEGKSRNRRGQGRGGCEKGRGRGAVEVELARRSEVRGGTEAKGKLSQCSWPGQGGSLRKVRERSQRLPRGAKGSRLRNWRGAEVGGKLGGVGMDNC